MAAPLDHPPNSPQALAELSGTVLGQRYALGRILGSGGMGAVFEAADLRLERGVAIKVLRPVFAGHTEYIRRFLREAQTASKIRHRNVVVILDYGEAAGGLVYSVMELCVGQDLELLLRGQPEQRLPWAQACDLLVQIASGLKAAHGQGVIHRDIKPANCFLTTEDDEPVVKVVDFGIAKLEDAAHTQQLTGTGNLLGTPSYIAPELVRTQRPASTRSDVYSLGVVAYRMLTGRLPFTGETAFEVMRRACMDAAPSLREQVPEVPEAVEGLVLEMLAKEPEERPADMGVVRQRLQAIGRETFGAQVVEIPVSSRLTLDGEARAPPATTEPATMPRDVAARGGTARAEPPAVEITAVQLEPLPEDFGRRPSRPPGAAPAVIVATVGAPQRAVHDPASSMSRSGETLPAIGEATLRMGESTAAIERPRRRIVAWLAFGGVFVGAVFGGMALSTTFGENQKEGSSPDGSSEVAIVEPEGAGGAADVEVVVPPLVVDIPGSTGETGGTKAGSSDAAAEKPVVDRVATVDLTPADESEKPPKAATRSQPPKQPAGPPSDATLKKKLASKIKDACGTKMGGKSVTVSFLVTKSGGISLLTAAQKNAAGQCAKQQVMGTKFRPRKGKDTPIEIVVE